MESEKQAATERTGMKTRVRNSRTFYAFLCSYLVILMFPIVVFGLFTYRDTFNILEEEINEKNMQMIHVMKGDLDNRLSELRRITLSICADESITAFSNVNLPHSGESRYRAYRIANDLQPYGSGSELVNDIYLIYDNSQTVIGVGAKYSIDFFSEAIMSLRDEDTLSWLNEQFSAFHYLDFHAAAAVEYKGSNTNLILMTHTISSRRGRKSSAMLLICMQSDYISGLLNNSAGDGYAYIVNDDGEVIATSDNYISDVSLKPDEWQPEKDGMVVVGRNVVSYCKSDVCGWKYISVLNRNAIYRKIESIRRQTLAMVLIVLALGIGTSYFLSGKHYQPVGKIISMLEGRRSSAVGETKGKNEMEYILSFVDGILSYQETLERENKENKALNERLNANRPIVRTALLQSLLGDGRYPVEKQTLTTEELRVLQENGLRFPCRRIWVLLINSTLSTEDTIAVSEEIFAEDMAYILEADYDLIAVVLNTPEGQREVVEERARELISRLEITVAISSEHVVGEAIEGNAVYSNPQEIAYAYAEALHTLKNSNPMNRQSILYFHPDIGCGGQEGAQYHYNFEEEAKLLSSIRRSNVQTAVSCVDDIIARHVYGENINLMDIRCFFYDLLGTLYRVAPDRTYANIRIISEDILPGAHTIDELCSIIRQTVEELAVSNCHETEPSVRVRQIVAYVDAHYSSNELTQTAIAKRFGVTSVYLSRAFKTATGWNMVDYIGMRRVEKIKEMLLEEYAKDSGKPLSMEDIAKKVGYLSDVTMIRAFKRFESVTPKQWITEHIGKTEPGGK